MTHAHEKILVPLSGRYDPDDPESLDAVALEVGLKVGQELEAHVEILCVTGPPREPEKALAAWIPSYGIEQLLDMIEQEGEARHERAKLSFKMAINSLEIRPAITSEASSGFSAEFVEHVGEIRQSVGRGRLADLVVIANSPERWRWHFRPILDAALWDTGRPLLVSPPKAPPSLGRRVAIACNGSIEASRAVAALLAFIQPGARVLIMSVAEGGAAIPGVEDVADYLRWHGVEGKALELPDDARSSADVILRRALESNCDLLAMGACIHSHAHRAVFGSMTATALSAARIPVLMAT